MRDILFRGKDVHGTWHYGGYINVPYGNDGKEYFYGISEDSDVPQNGGTYYELKQIDPETVGQYTGFMDKNGNKIFEGDIVRAPQSELFLEYRGDKNDLHGFINGEVYFDAGYILIQWEGDMFDDSSISLIEPLEVIGNIYDNPEILEIGDIRNMEEELLMILDKMQSIIQSSENFDSMEFKRLSEAYASLTRNLKILYMLYTNTNKEAGDMIAE